MMSTSDKAHQIRGKQMQEDEKIIENSETTNEMVTNSDNKTEKEKEEKLPSLTHPEQKFDLLKNKGVSVVAFLDTVRKGIKGKSTVRLKIIYKRYPKYYSTKIQMLPEDWKKIIGLKTRGDLKEDKIIIHGVLRKALEIIYSMDVFSFEEFDKQFLEKEEEKDDVFAAYEAYRKLLKDTDRLGNENMYHYSSESLKDFHGGNRLSFKSINVTFLRKYESHAINEGKSLTTIGMYLRCLRYLYNEAIKKGIVKNEDYPFGIGKYEIPKPRNIKKALLQSDIEKIFNYLPKNPAERFFRDIWLFSFLSNGMNMKDICQLKYSNINGDYIYYRRAKTINTDRNSKPIDVVILKEISAIIDQWGNKPVESDSFIFPFLKSGMTPVEVYKTIRQATASTNHHMQNVAKALEIDSKLTTYVARHSYATVLKRLGVSNAMISENMGHANIKTTENYLDSFEDEQKKVVARKLTEWKNGTFESENKPGGVDPGEQPSK